MSLGGGWVWRGIQGRKIIIGVGRRKIFIGYGLRAERGALARIGDGAGASGAFGWPENGRQFRLRRERGIPAFSFQKDVTTIFGPAKCVRSGGGFADTSRGTRTAGIVRTIILRFLALRFQGHLFSVRFEIVDQAVGG